MSAPDLHEPSVSNTGATIASTMDRVADTAARHERLLWGVVVCALVADVLLTYAGMSQGFTEGNPAMRWAIEAGGIGALVAAKISILGVGVTVRTLRPSHAGVIPLGLAIPWIVATAINASLIL